MGIFTPGRSKYAYQGDLSCPLCQSKAIRYVENVARYRDRYRCRKCGITFQYDYSAREDLNPYAAYGERSKFGQHLKKMLGGRKLKGGNK